MIIRYEKELVELSRSGARYLIIGSTALNAHGYIRATVGLDILPDLDSENLDKIFNVLKNSSYLKKEKPNNDYLMFIKDNTSEIFLLTIPSIKFEEWVSRKLAFSIKDVEIPVASVEDLLYLKKSTNRLKDLYDITILECLNESKEDKEIQEYLDKFKKRTPYQRLEIMSEFIDSCLNFMTPKGKEIFKQIRLEGISEN